MKKTKFLLACALSVCALGVMSGTSEVEKVKADDPVYTLSFGGGTNNQYASKDSISCDGMGWEAYGNNATDSTNIRIGGKSITSVDRTVTAKTAMASKIGKIDITYGTSTITVNSVTVSAYKTSTFSSANMAFSYESAFTASDTVSDTIDNSNNATNLYYQFAFNVTNSTTSNKYFQLFSIKFYEAVEEDTSTKVNVNFDTDGGSEIETKEIAVGKKVSKPTDPTKDNKVFDKWVDKDGKEYDFETVITEEITLYATWKNACTVSFDSNGGTAVTSIVVGEGDTVNKPTDPKKTGYEFVGWFDGEDEFDFTKGVTSNKSLVAKWNKLDLATYSKVKSVSSLYDGMKFVIASEESNVVAGAINGKYFESVSSGVTFDNGNVYLVDKTNYLVLKKNGTKWNICLPNGTQVKDNAGDLSTSSGTVDWTISFSTQGNAKIYASAENKPIYYNSGSPRFKPYVGGNEVQIYAAEATYHTVAFNTNGGNEIASRTNILDGSTISDLPTPTKTNYVFEGWYKDGVEFTQYTKVNDDITLVAKWKQGQSFFNSFVNNQRVDYRIAFNYTKTTYDDGDYDFSNFNNISLQFGCNFNVEGIENIVEKGIYITKDSECMDDTVGKELPYDEIYTGVGYGTLVAMPSDYTGETFIVSIDNIPLTSIDKQVYAVAYIKTEDGVYHFSSKDSEASVRTVLNDYVNSTDTSVTAEMKAMCRDLIDAAAEASKQA